MAGITPAWAGKSSCTTPSVPTPWDHPRVGGEKVVGLHKRNLSQGSPPRGRGKGTRLRYPWPLDRITPAWAGKSSSKPSFSAAAWDHPRVGGEKFFKTIIFGCSLGSPPRGRGKGMALTEANRVFGITPAWAGKSDNSENQSSKKQDHPRVGGEKALSSTALGLAIGSPPRGRGKGLFSTIPGGCPGITPAWAGKSA